MDYDFLGNNKVYLSGKIVEEPKFSHEIFGEGFYELLLSVPRLSNNIDVIPVTISERLLVGKNISVGNSIAIRGQFRSYNKLVDGKSRLFLTVFVRDLIEEVCENGDASNVIEIVGYVCKPPIFRTTPFSREICDVLLAVNRAYRKSDYLPCIAWGRNARFIKTKEIGDRIMITGRIQSREYQKKTEDGIENRIAYEISISKVSDSDAIIDANVNDCIAG